MPGKVGNKGGKKGRSGRKGYAEEMALHEILDIAWPKEARIKCFQNLADMAAKGHMEATKLLAAYTFGKPPETVNMQGAMVVKVVYGKGTAK